MEVRTIVVRSPNWIGDCVLSAPAILGVRDRYPDARLTVVAHSRVKDLLSMLPGIDCVKEFDSAKAGRGLRSMNRFAQTIWKEPIDLFIVFPMSFSSALMSYLSGARRRIGYASEMRRPLLNEPLVLPRDHRQRHLLLTYSDLVREVGVDGDLGEPRLVAPRSSSVGERLLLDSGVRSETTLVGIAPYASYGPAKRWALDRYRELGMELAKRHDCVTVVLGGKEDVQDGDRRGFEGSSFVDLCGRLSLGEAAWVMARCRCLVSNDTGIAHVAAALGTPVVSVFGSTSPVWTAPLGRGNRVLYRQVECSPCFKRVCRFGHYRCLTDVEVGAVLDCVEGILNG
jgi:heptosyltransferase-2